MAGRLVSAGIVFGRKIKDMNTGRVLYYRRQIGKDAAGYEWGPPMKMPPTGYTVCQNGSGHTWRAVSAGSLTVMRDVNTGEQWFFEKRSVRPLAAAAPPSGDDEDE